MSRAVVFFTWYPQVYSLLLSSTTSHYLQNLGFPEAVDLGFITLLWRELGTLEADSFPCPILTLHTRTS